MLKIHIPEVEDYDDERNNEFINIKACDLVLEHSLISISEWEARWHKPFLTTKEKTNEEILDYIRCMVMRRDANNVDPRIFEFIPEEELKRIQEYIEDDHTATCFKKSVSELQGRRPEKKEVLTSEVIYYYMIALGIPKDFEKWHLGRLQTLIKVCNEKNKEQDPKYKNKQLTTKDQARLAADYHALNQKRRAALNTKG